MAAVTRLQLERVLGPGLVIAACPDVRWWPCPVCAAGLDSPLIRDELGGRCMSGHSWVEVCAAVSVLDELRATCEGWEP